MGIRLHITKLYMIAMSKYNNTMLFLTDNGYIIYIYLVQDTTLPKSEELASLKTLKEERTSLSRIISILFMT